MMRLVASIICLLLAVSSVRAQDVYLTNLKGYSVSTGALVHFDTLLIKNGRIRAAGPEALIAPYAGDAVRRDMGGKTILPGFVDGHISLAGYAAYGCKDSGLADFAACLRGFLLTRAKSGYTLVMDGAVTPRLWTALRRLEASKTLPIRVHGAIAGYGDPYDALSKDGPIVGTYENRLTLRAFALTGTDDFMAADLEGGANDGAQRLNTCKAPRQAMPEPVKLRNYIARAMMRGYQVQVEAFTPETAAASLSAFADIAEIAGAHQRHRLLSFPLALVGLAPDLGRTGVLPVINLCALEGMVAADERAALKTLANAEVDFLISGSNPMMDFKIMVRRGGLSRAQALAALTLNGAQAAYLDSATGSLESGKWADFVVLDQDVMNIPPDRISRTRILETWVAGQQVGKR